MGDHPSKAGKGFHQETQYIRGALPGGDLQWEERPEPYKTYPQAISHHPLPPPDSKKSMPLWRALQLRRSRRRYTPEPLELQELSQLLWAAQGVTANVGGYLLRTAPSAGALYPLETYIIINRVEGLEAGLYHYDVRQHSLEFIRRGDLSAAVSAASLNQAMPRLAPAVFLWTAIPLRSQWKYKERAWRYIYLDAGHLAQNLHLAAVSLGLGCCAIGAFYDEEINELLGVNGKKETIIYLSTVGRMSAPFDEEEDEGP